MIKSRIEYAGFCFGVAGFIPRCYPMRKIHCFSSFLLLGTAAQVKTCYSIQVVSILFLKNICDIIIAMADKKLNQKNVQVFA